MDNSEVDYTKPLKVGELIVPKIWAYLIPDDFQYFRIPHEKRASCFSCPKIKSAGFDSVYKCCTYNPRVANFLLGFALEDPSTAPKIEKMIAEGFSTPEGMIHTPAQHRESLSHNAKGLYGQVDKVFCRFLDKASGGCGIYAYRNAVCSTFHCLHEYGLESAGFWEALGDLVSQAETAISQWVMKELGFEPETYFKTMNGMSRYGDRLCEPNGSWSKESLTAFWGDWLGKEKEFFLACSKLVRDNHEKIYDIACDVGIQAPEQYEAAFRESLPDDLKKEYDAEGPVTGTFLPIPSLWYTLQAAHHHVRSKILAEETKDDQGT